LDSNGLCTICNATALIQSIPCTSDAVKFDNQSCVCVCSSLNCDLYNNGQVVNTSAFCACRQCHAGECYCGNGIVEPGEQCDVGTNSNPCCVQCQFTRNPCSDNNGCTDTDICNGNGTCIGNYKCPSSSTCASVSCDPNVGNCVTTNAPNTTICNGNRNLCQSRCLNGLCNNATTVCPPQNNASLCMTPVCQPSTGVCQLVPSNGVPCNDGNSCTSSDTCVKGVCTGVPIVCPQPTNPCLSSSCLLGTCVTNSLSNKPCDDLNACTVGDACVNGKCIPGIPTVCNSTGQCKLTYCNTSSGLCGSSNVPNVQNLTCDDGSICTTSDRCIDGECTGVKDPTTANATACCPTCSPAASASSVHTKTTAIFSAIGAAALLGAIAGAVFLVKKIRDSKITNPDTWDPDKFVAIGGNPLYKGSDKVVNNALYVGN